MQLASNLAKKKHESKLLIMQPDGIRLLLMTYLEILIVLIAEQLQTGKLVKELASHVGVAKPHGRCRGDVEFVGVNTSFSHRTGLC